MSSLLSRDLEIQIAEGDLVQGSKMENKREIRGQMLSNFLTSSCSATPTRRVAGSKESFDSFHVRVRSEIPGKHEDCTERCCRSGVRESANLKLVVYFQKPAVSDLYWNWDEGDISQLIRRSGIRRNQKFTRTNPRQFLKSRQRRIFSISFFKNYPLLKTAQENVIEKSTRHHSFIREFSRWTYYSDRFIRFLQKKKRQSLQMAVFGHRRPRSAGLSTEFRSQFTV